MNSIYMYYPQSLEDENLLKQLQTIQNKFRMKLTDGLIIIKHNSQYPRLSCTNKRGVEAGRELVANLCNGLINNAPISILYDIIQATLTDNNYWNLLCSNIPLTILHLDTNIPTYILHDQDYHINMLLNYGDHYDTILKLIKSATLTEEEIKRIISLV